jgi:hypothetical protein
MTSAVSNEASETSAGNVSSSFQDLTFPGENSFLLSLLVKFLRRNSRSLAVPFLPEGFLSNATQVGPAKTKGANPFNLY